MRKKLELKVKKLYPDSRIPRYGRHGDAAIDLYCRKDYTLKPGEKKIFGSGVAMEIPEKFVGLIWSKGGLGAKHGMVSLGGVIDSNYRGEVVVGLYNSSKKSYKFAKGDKVAQLLVQSVASCQIREVKNLSKTQRGTGKFGSSAKR